MLLCGAVQVAITGTPGTGKSSTCDVLDRRGYLTLDLDAIARREGFVVGRDEARQSDEVDVDALQRFVHVPAKIVFLRAHYSHLLDVDTVVVLRCRPDVLRQRLMSRGWTEDKVRENVEAEAIDVVLQEALRRTDRVYQIDTTELTPEATADRVLEILGGRTEGHGPDAVDWTDVVLSWY